MNDWTQVMSSVLMLLLMSVLISIAIVLFVSAFICCSFAIMLHFRYCTCCLELPLVEEGGKRCSQAKK